MSPCHQLGLTLIPTRISNYMFYEMKYEISYPLPNYNSTTVEIWEWINNFISHILGMWLFSMLAKGHHERSNVNMIASSLFEHGILRNAILCAARFIHESGLQFLAEIDSLRMANGKYLFHDNIGMLLLNPHLLTYDSFGRSLRCMSPETHYSDWYLRHYQTMACICFYCGPWFIIWCTVTKSKDFLTWLFRWECVFRPH